MAKQDRQPIRVTDLSDLGRHFGIVAPTPPAAAPTGSGKLERFMGLSVLDKLNFAFRVHLDHDPLASQMKHIAVKEALVLDPEVCSALGIRFVTYVPLTAEGAMPSYDALSYNMDTIFPFGKGVRYVGVNRQELQNAFNPEHYGMSSQALREIDNLVAQRAELRPEQLVDRYHRSLREIKTVDAIIKKQKISTLSERGVRGSYRDVTRDRISSVGQSIANEDKDKAVLSYLRCADDMHVEYPYLGRVFNLDRTNVDDLIHATLTMSIPGIRNHHERLFNPSVPVVLDNRRNERATTNLHLRKLQQRRDSALAGSPLEIDGVSAEICRRLGI